jgi:NADH:ubiquinone oxidoreductase subunit 6 (subunit J)
MMNFAESIFLLVMCVTMISALVTVLSGSIIYALVGLVATMFGIAGLYVYLNAPFLAMMQILIYVGAISIIIAFAIMLAGPLYKRPKEWTTTVKFIVSFVVSLFSFVILFKVIMHAPWMDTKATAFTIATKDIGRVLFDKLTLPFELISLLIVVSIVGAIMLAFFSKGEK